MSFNKLIVMLCLFLFSSIVVNQDITKASINSDSVAAVQATDTTKYVNSKGGLILRETPDSKGKKISMLKDGSKVYVYSTDENGWSYIKQGKFKGYVKDSYLITKKQTSTSSGKNANKTRVIDFSMSINQVKKTEPAKFIKKVQEGNITVLQYEVEKYGYLSQLRYYFVDEKLDIISFEFLPSRKDYLSWSEMETIYALLHKKATSEFGEDYFFSSDDLTVMGANWEKKSYSVLLNVNRKDLYTSATLTYYQK